MAVRGVRAGIGGVRRWRLIPLVLSWRRTVAAIGVEFSFSGATSCADGGTLLRRGSVKPRAVSMKGMWCTITLGSCMEHHCSISARSMSPPVNCAQNSIMCELSMSTKSLMLEQNCALAVGGIADWTTSRTVAIGLARWRVLAGRDTSISRLSKGTCYLTCIRIPPAV